MTFSARTRAGLTLLFQLVAGILPLGCSTRSRPDKAGTPAARSGPLPAGVVALGRIVPGERVIHVSGPTGVVKELLVKRHDRVSRGQVLALLLNHDNAAAALVQAARDVDVASSLLAQAKAGEKAGTLAAQQALVASAKAALDNARTSHARVKALFDQGIGARADLDQASLVLAQAEASLHNAQEVYRSLADIRPVDLAVLAERLRSAQSAKATAQTTLDLSEIRAPMDGLVLDINTYPGEAAGASGLLDLGDTADMEVEAEVDVMDIGRVRVGNRAAISGEGLAAETAGAVEEIYGTVTANAVINPQPLANADLRVVRVRIRPDHPELFTGLVNALVTVKLAP
jgi:HlyD family secretion protein